MIADEGYRIPRRFVTRGAVEDEVGRLDQAIKAASEEIAANRDALSQELGTNDDALFEAHMQILHDDELASEMQEMIRERHYSAEYAVSRALRRYAQVLQRLEGRHRAEKALDFFDIEKRLLRHLLKLRGSREEH